MAFIVKNTAINLLDLICPHYCKGCGKLGETFCECCKKDILIDHINYCPNCKRPVYQGCCPYCNLPPIFVGGWRDEIIGKMVEDYKYNSERALLGNLTEILDIILPEIDGKVAMVPLPTTQKHIRARGFDHTYKIAKKVAKRRRWRVEKLITRAKNTVQVGANEKTRIAQANSAYRMSGVIDRDATYIIFDDVWTTGASVRAALKKLQEAGARKIIIAVLAISRTRSY